MTLILRCGYLPDERFREGTMKKKGPRSIPDFSTKRAPVPNVQDASHKHEPAPVVPNRGTKPHATSKKSGLRGQ